MSSPLIKDLPYSARLDHAVTWSLANPNESFPTSARIHRVAAKSVRSRVVRARSSPGPGAGGQNRVLTADKLPLLFSTVVRRLNIAAARLEIW